jgi:hypothetical protein
VNAGLNRTLRRSELRASVSKFTRFDEVSPVIKRIKRVRLDQKAKSKSKSMTPAPARRFRLFDEPQVLEGEDPAAYNELLARICDAIKPVDTIEEMFIADVVSSEWGVAMAPLEMDFGTSRSETNCGTRLTKGS